MVLVRDTRVHGPRLVQKGIGSRESADRRSAAGRTSWWLQAPWRRWSRGWRRGSRSRWRADPAAAMGGAGRDALRVSTGTGRRWESRKGAMWWRWWSFPSASRFPRSVGFLWEGFVAANLVGRAPAPLPFYIARATGAHQPDGLGVPDQGASRECDSAFGPSREINPNILPLDLFLFLILVLHMNHFIIDHCIGRASS